MAAVARVMLSLRFTCGRTDLLTVWVLLSLTRRGPPLPSAPQCPFQTSIHTFTASLIFAWHSFTTPIKILFRYYKNDEFCPNSTRLDRKADRSWAASPPPPLPWNPCFCLQWEGPRASVLPLCFTLGSLFTFVLRDRVSLICSDWLWPCSMNQTELELWSSHLRPPGSRTAGLCLQTQLLLWF